jgi:catalase (peroxidase I)
MFDRNNNQNPSGAVGSVRFFSDHPANGGLAGTFGNLFVSPANANGVSAADMIAMAGMVAVTHCGGPKIPFAGGRIDQTQAVARQNPGNPNRLPFPSETFQQVMAKFERMGLSGVEQALLSMISLSIVSLGIF